MSFRRFVAQIILLISISSLAGAGLLLFATCELLDLGVEARRAELFKFAIYAVVCIVTLNGLVLAQLRGVLRLLCIWDRGLSPDERIVRYAQRQALTFPDRFAGELTLLTLVLVLVVVCVDVKLKGYQLIPDLINAALTLAYLLATGFVINTGLREVLHPILVRIPLPPLSTWPSSSIVRRIILAMLLVMSTVLVSAGAFAYSYVTKGVDELNAQELIYRLETVIVPAVRESGLKPDALATYARAGEELFLLTRSARYIEHKPTRSLTTYERRLLAQAQAPLSYKRDYSSFRLIAVPVDEERVLGLAYDSPATQLASARDALRVYLFLSAVALAFAAIAGGRLGHDLVRALGYVVRRMEALAGQTEAVSGTPLSYPSLDEMGELVGAFNRIQQHTASYTAQLQTSVEALKTASLQRQQLLDTMVGLTAPVIPVAEGIAVVLLSGYFDEDRAMHIRPNLLNGIVRTRARMTIVDLTAVAQVSAPLTEQLSAAIRAVRLMGCQVVLTGIGPELAWALSQADTELESLPSRRRLEDGLAYAYERLSMN